MNKLLKCTDRNVKEATWKDFALIKLCMGSAGLLVGMATPKKAKKNMAFGAMIVFIATYVPLMLKFLGILLEDRKAR